MNTTSTSNVVCLDIIDFSKKSQTEQTRIMQQFHTLLDRAIVDIPEKDRTIVETAHGAIINCSGQLESALEDALFIALTIRDEALNANASSGTPLYLLIGIHLGAISINHTSTSSPSISGEGVTEAQRIMSFANPNQILVSADYYDMASKLTLEVAQMFEKYDMHAHEHDIYAVRRLNEGRANDQAAITLEPIGDLVPDSETNTSNWRAYILPALLALIMFFVLIKAVQYDDPASVPDDVELEGTTSDDVSIEGLALDAATDNQTTAPLEQPAEDSATAAAKESVKKTTAKKAVKKKITPSKTNPVDRISTEPVATSVDEATKTDTAPTVKVIKERTPTRDTQPCSQAEIAMNQCKQ